MVWLGQGPDQAQTMPNSPDKRGVLSSPKNHMYSSDLHYIVSVTELCDVHAGPRVPGGFSWGGISVVVN